MIVIICAFLMIVTVSDFCFYFVLLNLDFATNKLITMNMVNMTAARYLREATLASGTRSVGYLRRSTML